MNTQSSGRLANGLPDAHVVAKSGSLLGVVRNEVGVAEFPNGDVYALAVFTRTHRTDFGAGPAIDRAMAVVSGLLVEEVHGSHGAGA
jgi:beta-lactamase class A